MAAVGDRLRERTTRWPTAERTARYGSSIYKRQLSAALAVLAVALLATLPNASSAESAASWTLKLENLGPNPQKSGAFVEFRLSLGCAALAAPACTNGTVTIPLDPKIDRTSGKIAIDPHPYIKSNKVVGDDYVITLDPNFPAGSTMQVNFRMTSLNGQTPDGYVATIRAIAQADNTTTQVQEVTETFQAEAEIQVKKFLPADAPPDTPMPLDETIRYRIRTCDPRSTSSTLPGRLFIEKGTVVDTLPNGAKFVGASGDGTYDADKNTVTWALTDQPAVPCSSTSNGYQYWVDASYPSDRFTTSDSVTNKVTASGTPYGATDPISASYSLPHKFGKPDPNGYFCKAAIGAMPPYYPCNSPDSTRTWPGPWVFPADAPPQPGGEASFQVAATNNSPVAGTVDVVDPMPCRSNSDGAASPMFTSNSPGTYCSDPAFIVRSIVPSNWTLFGSNGVRTVQGTWAKAADAGSRPTYITPDGQEHDFVFTDTTPTKKPPIGSTKGYLVFTPHPGDVVSEVRWGALPAGPGDGGTINIYGYLDERMNDKERVQNIARETLNVGASSQSATVTARIQAIEGNVVYAHKYTPASSADPSQFYIYAGAQDGGTDQTWDKGLVLADLLPVGVPTATLTQVNYAKVGKTTYQSADRLTPADYRIETIPNYDNTGRTMLRFTLPPGFKISNTGPTTLLLTFNVPGGNPPGTRTNDVRAFVPGHDIDACLVGSNGNIITPVAASLYTSDTNDWDGDGATTDTYCRGSGNMVNTTSSPLVRAIKEVKGNLDSNYAQFPGVGRVDPSQPGGAAYRLTIRNDGSVGAKNIVLYDVLPAPNDTGVSAALSNVPRRSDFAPTLAGAVTPPSGWTVEYSHAGSPCRSEVGDGSATWPSGCTNDWNSAVGNASTVTAIRLKQATTGVLGPNQTAVFTWNMTIPGLGLPLLAPRPGDVAWNSVAYSATRSDNGQKLPVSEPPKVGLAVPQADISLAKAVDRTDPLVGEAVQYTLTVKHDTQIVQGPNGSVNYVDANGNPTGNIAPATGVVVTDALPDGLEYVPGSAVVQRGSFDPATGRWDVGTLQPGESGVLRFSALVKQAGTLVNTAEVTGENVSDADSSPGNCTSGLMPATEDDCKSVSVRTVAPAITLHKLVASKPDSDTYLEAPAGSSDHGVFPSGAAVPYRFVVENTGEVPLTTVTISDPKIPTFCDDKFAIGDLAAGASKTIDCVWPLGWNVGTTVNTAKVTGQPRSGPPVTASDDAEVFVPSPAVKIEKSTNGKDADAAEDAVAVDVRDPITWRYVITNSGTDDLTDIALSDDKESAVTLDDDHCDRSEGSWGDPLPPDATITCEYSGTANYGFYTNTGTVTAKGRITPIEVTDSDASGYIAPQPKPSVSIKKYTNDVDADTDDTRPKILEGDPVTWRYVIVNDGNEPLTNVALVDDREAKVALSDDDCDRSAGAWGDALQPGDTIECMFSSVATPGDYMNIGKVTATSVDTSTAVSDDDPSGYTGTLKPTPAEIQKERGFASGSVTPGTSVKGESEENRGGASGSGDLPRTGAPIVLLVWTSLSLLLSGWWLQRIARR